MPQDINDAKQVVSVNINLVYVFSFVHVLKKGQIQEIKCKYNKVQKIDIKFHIIKSKSPEIWEEKILLKTSCK